jgi:hypothetical protein
MRWSDIRWDENYAQIWHRAVGPDECFILYRATHDHPVVRSGTMVLHVGKQPFNSANNAHDARPPSQFGIPDVMAILAHHAGIEWEADDA